MSGQELHIRKGLTLIELLVAIAVIGVLAAVTLCAVQSIRELAQRTECKNNLKQLHIAVETYHQNKRRYPLNYDDDYRAGWAIALLPYLEKKAVRSEFDSFPLADAATTLAFIRTNRPSQYACPSASIQERDYGRAPLTPVTHYSYNLLLAGKFRVPNGMSSTFLFQELPSIADNLTPWHLSPSVPDILVSYVGGGVHAACANAVFVDGHVSLVSFGELP